MLHGVFPDDAKIALVSPLYKGTSDHSVGYFNNFLENNAKVAKRSLDVDMNKFLFSFLSTYSKNYSTQYDLVCFVKEWRERIHNNMQ